MDLHDEISKYVGDLIDRTAQRRLQWQQIDTYRYSAKVGVDVRVVIRSRNGDGAPPYVIETNARNSAGQMTGDTGNPSYDNLFKDLFDAARTLAVSGPPSWRR